MFGKFLIGLVPVFLLSTTFARPAVLAPAETVCLSDTELSAVSQIRNLSGTFRDAACIQNYQINKCAEFKKTLAPEDQAHVITCSDKDALSTGKVLLSCGSGVKSYIVDTATGVVHLVSQLPYLPRAILAELQKTGDYLKQCQTDPQLRVALFQTVSSLYSEAEQKNILDTLSCEGLMDTIRGQTQNGVNDLEAKKKLQAEFARRRPGEPLPDRLKLTPGEEVFQQRYYLAADTENARLNAAIGKIWNHVSSSLACYSQAAKVQMTCAAIADIAATVTTGGAVAPLAKTSQVQKVARSAERLLSPTEMMEMRRALAAEPERPRAVLNVEDINAGPTTRSKTVDLNATVRGPPPTVVGQATDIDTATMPLNRNGAPDMDAGFRNRQVGFWDLENIRGEDRRRRVLRQVTPDAVHRLADDLGLAPSQISYSPTVRLRGRSVLKDEESLLNGSVVSKEKMGQSSANDVSVVTLQDGTKGVWKPHREKWQSNYRAEVLAYELDRSLGFNLVPPTVTRTINGQVGSLQLFKNSVAGKAPRQQDLNRQSLFDYLIENKDRHKENYLVSEKGDLISIDNGLSFTGFGGNGANFSQREKGIRAFLKTSDGRNVVTNIRKFVADPSSQKQLTEYLGREDANRVLIRMRSILKYDQGLDHKPLMSP